MKKSNVLLVNPFSSGAYLSDFLKAAGVGCTALYTTSLDHGPAYCHPSMTDFDSQEHMPDCSLDEISEFVSAQKFDLILNGFEQSTALTDYLSRKFTPRFSNNPETSRLRCDKYEMQNAVKAEGLPHIRQIRLQSPFGQPKLDEILKELQLPVFCKPNSGIGSVGAFAAVTEGELAAGLTQAFANGATDYLVQDLVQGTEYVVDTFSADGKHHVCGVFAYQKKFVDQSPLYRSVELVHDPLVWDRCCAYACALLDALDLKFGFAHIEIMIENDGTIKLMELNNRMSGACGLLGILCSLTGLTSQAAALLQLISTGEVHTNPGQDAVGRACGLFLFKFDDGYIVDPRPKLAQFPTVRNVDICRQPGSVSTRGPHLDLTDVACFAALHGRSERELDRDAEAIFALEAVGELV